MSLDVERSAQSNGPACRPAYRAEGEHPIFWQNIVAHAVGARKSDLARLLKASTATGEAERGTSNELTDLLRQLGPTVLVRLYPETKRS